MAETQLLKKLPVGVKGNKAIRKYINRHILRYVSWSFLKVIYLRSKNKRNKYTNTITENPIMPVSDKSWA